MKTRQIILFACVLIGVLSLFLPVLVKEYDHSLGFMKGISTHADGEREYISGLEYQFPLFPIVSIAVLIASLFIGIGRAVGFAVAGLIIMILTAGYLLLLLFGIHFTLFADYRTYTGIGYYLLASSVLTVLIISIVQIARPKGVVNKRNEHLLDDL